MNTRYVASVVFGLLLCVACGRAVEQSTAGAGTGSAAGASASDAGAARDDAARGGTCGNVTTPKEHRAVAQACPAGRGSLGPVDTTACTNRSRITCHSDADCTAGENGRCFLNGDPCQTVCSYDQCLTDRDCAAGPCVCRSSSTDLAPNDCLPTSNCRTDADCDCNSCSPSVVSNSADCGPGNLSYACHTANDECIDQSDCLEGESCGYDAGAGRWRCGFCVPAPHP